MPLLLKEWLSIIKNKKLAIALAALLFIPILYSGVYLYAFWDPYGKLDNLPVAVVNHDQGAEYEGKTLHIGDDFVENLKTNDEFDWHFVSGKEAQKGLKNRQYYMAIEIPENFSENATTLLEDEKRPLKLSYWTNEGYNYLSSKINETAIQKIKEEIGNEISETYAESMFANMKNLSDGLQEASNGAAKIHDGANKIHDGSAQLKEKLKLLSQGALTFSTSASKAADGGQQLALGATNLSNGLSRLQAGGDQLLEGADKAKAGTAQLQNGLKQSLEGSKALKENSAKLTEGTDQLYSETTNMVNRLSQMAQGMNKASEGSKQLSAGLEKLDQEVGQLQSFLVQLQNLPPDVQRQLGVDGGEWKKLQNSVHQLAEGSKQLSQNMETLSNGAAALSERGKELPNALKTLQSGQLELTNGLATFASGQQQLLNGAAEIYDGQVQLSQGLKTFSEKLGEANSGAAKLVSGSKELASGLMQLDGGSSSLQKGAAKIAEGAESLDEGTKDLASGTGEMSEKLAEAADKTKGVNGNDQTYEMMASPVKTEEHKIDYVPNYGTGFAPYFLSLGLWVGALMLTIIYPLRKPADQPKSAFSWFVSKFATLFFIAALQAVIADSILLFGLGLKVESLPAFYLFSVLTSITFMAIIQFLTTSMADPGRFIAVILLILQLVSSGGTYPIELVPDFFQQIGKWLPMTHSVSGFKAVISTGDMPYLRNEALILAIFFTLFLLLLVVLFIALFHKQFAQHNDSTASGAVR